MESPLRRVSNPLSLWSLRSRLVVGVVVLSALGFGASDVAARNSLRSFLVNQVDTQLTSVAGGSVLRLDRVGIAPDDNSLPPTSTSESNDGKAAASPAPVRNKTALRPLRS